MRALIQRVKSANVKVNNQVIGEINNGILALIAIEPNDDELIADRLLEKILYYRIFSDREDKMNRSLIDVSGGLLIVSQFTLAADTKKGLRPSFTTAASSERGKELYEYFIKRAKEEHDKVAEGEFAANMQVELINDGPVTFMLTA